MISFMCPRCAKKHTVRDRHALRRGFCECGAVLIVPEAGAANDVQGPRLIGQLDLHAAERQARNVRIAVSIVGIVVVIAIVSVAYFHNGWERENKSRLLALKEQGDAFVATKEFEKAKAKYDEIFGLLGDRLIKDENLRSEIDSARIAAEQNNAEVEALLATREAAFRKRLASERQKEERSRVFVAQTSAPRGAMTYENYLKIEDGMSKSDIEWLLDNFSPQEQGRAGTLQTIMWKGPNGEIVVCTLDDDHLTAKSQSGLR